MHFISLASAWASELSEPVAADLSIEDYTVDFQDYIASALRGRQDVNPEHSVFRDQNLKFRLNEMVEQAAENKTNMIFAAAIKELLEGKK